MPRILIAECMREIPSFNPVPGEPHMFDDWAEKKFNIDAPGAASANLQSLGRRICRRPMFPLDDEATCSPAPDIFRRGLPG